MRAIVLAAAFSIMIHMSSASADVPNHSVEISDMKPRAGKRVQVNVPNPVTKTQCRELIELHRSKGMPNGQISVHAPSPKFEGHVTPHCVDNFEGEGIQIHEYLY